MKLSLLILLNFISFFAPAPQRSVPASIYDFKVAALNGDTIDLSAYKGKKILIVNAPTQAYYDVQYSELNQLYGKYKDKLVIIAFLADDFGVEPGAKLDRTFDQSYYNVSFPLASKVLIKGKDKAPIYHWLTEKQYNNFKDSEVKWNFQKYLINEKGALVAVFDPKVRASNNALISAIEN